MHIESDLLSEMVESDINLDKHSANVVAQLEGGKENEDYLDNGSDEGDTEDEEEDEEEVKNE